MPRELAISPGERVLDLGCGTGLLAEYVAGLVGPSGSVLGVEPLPLRVTLAQRRARPNLSFRVGNANDLSELEAKRFDVVYLNAVLHWLSDKLGPLQQIFRVLKSGGQLGISAGGRLGISALSDDRDSPLRVAALQVFGRPPYNAHALNLARVIHRVSKPELEELLNTAGFRIKLLELRTSVQHHPTPEAAIEFAEASSFGNFLGHLPGDLRVSAREAIAVELSQAMTPEGIKRETTRIVAVALKP
ncbi:MAG: methyltransferase domain-containing protein [Candidatus Binataceae bacterium]